MITSFNKVRLKTMLHLFLAQILFSSLYVVTVQYHLPSNNNSTNSSSSYDNPDTAAPIFGTSTPQSDDTTAKAANRGPAKPWWKTQQKRDESILAGRGRLESHHTVSLAESAARTWIAKSPWDAPPEGFYSPNATGSFQNCTRQSTTMKSNHPSYSSSSSVEPPVIYSGQITISCHTISFKAPSLRLYNAGPLIIGILSAASGSGPRRRNYIRSTWASSQYTNGTFFLVAGPWEDIENEFEFYKDMIWINEKEIYQGEKSVLTYKTISYFVIAHMFGAAPQQEGYDKNVGRTGGGWQHAIKTDDDSYVNLKLLEEKLIRPQGDFHNLHYYGQCPQFQVKPSRDKTNKWPVTYQTYPEPKFPLYCQGAGFGLSRELVRTAVEGGHVENFRYMPFEDVSIGIIAERCGRDKFHATMIPGVKVFRADTKKERDCVNRAIPMTECYKGDDSWPPDARMSHHLIQHRVDDRDDMISIHKSLGLDVYWVQTLDQGR